jgi:AcrR family transcriptional regulator
MSPPRRAAESTEALRSSLVEHALRLVARQGPGALTMRALAAEADCSVGLPYKVFEDRQALVVAACQSELHRLVGNADELAARAGTGSVGANLCWFSEQLLDSPAVALAQEVMADDRLGDAVAAHAHDGGAGPGDFESAFVRYLTLEQDGGRVRGDVDVTAVAFLVAGAVHNLVVSGPAWPRPSRDELGRRLDAAAAAIAPAIAPAPRPET